MALGLPHSVFPMKTELALLIGASLFLDLISQHLFALILLILLIGLILLALAKIPALEKFSADFVNLKKKAQAYKIWTLCKAALFLIGFALFYSWIYERSVQYGINEANSYRLSWTEALTVDSNESNPISIISFQDSSANTTKEIKGIIFTASEAHYAVYTLDGVLIIPKEKINLIKAVKP
jgi:hypothetical protein